MALHQHLRDAGLPSPAFGVFTTRAGGGSAAPYDTFNLAAHVGDDVGSVSDNRVHLRQAVGHPLVFAHQVHGNGVALVDGAIDDVADVDALVTTQRQLALVILTADCVPVLFADTDAGVVAAAHAGRAGLVAGVIPQTLHAMQSAGARLPSISAWLGPSICGRCYELPPDVVDATDAAVPGTRTVTARGTSGIDVAAGVRTQLAAAGVRSVRTQSRCAAEDPALYSYRRDGVTGRFASVVWLT